MPLIMRIRNFLRLDKAAVVVSTEFSDSVGLWIHEKNELMKAPVMQSCLVGAHPLSAMPDAHSHPLLPCT